MKMIANTFMSSKTTAKIPTSSLHITSWSSPPQIELWTEDDGGQRNKIGPSVVLVGNDLTTFLEWINNLGEKK